jgi:hypothetical protein
VSRITNKKIKKRKRRDALTPSSPSAPVTELLQQVDLAMLQLHAASLITRSSRLARPSTISSLPSSHRRPCARTIRHGEERGGKPLKQTQQIKDGKEVDYQSRSPDLRCRESGRQPCARELLVGAEVTVVEEEVIVVRARGCRRCLPPRAVEAPMRWI